jgi:hypothetical protein
MASAPDHSFPNEEGSVGEWNERKDSDIACIRDQAYLLMRQDSSCMLVMDTSMSDKAMAT